MVFFIPAGGKGLICGAGSARSRRGRHTLRCRCIPARCGRRPTLYGADAGLRFSLRPFRRGRGLMISCRKLSEQAQAGAPLLCADGAVSPRGACVGAHRATEISFALLSFSSLSVRATHFAAAGVSFFYDSFCSFELHLSLHFLPVLANCQIKCNTLL